MQMPGRNASTGDYRYGFQAQETDDEITGSESHVAFTFRCYDTRVGRFLSIDPLTSDYPHYTPYSFSGNKVIAFIELEGLEEFDAVVNKDKGKASLTVVDDKKVQNQTGVQVNYKRPGEDEPYLVSDGFPDTPEGNAEKARAFKGKIMLSPIDGFGWQLSDKFVENKIIAYPLPPQGNDAPPGTSITFGDITSAQYETSTGKFRVEFEKYELTLSGNSQSSFEQQFMMIKALYDENPETFQMTVTTGTNAEGVHNGSAAERTKVYDGTFAGKQSWAWLSNMRQSYVKQAAKAVGIPDNKIKYNTVYNDLSVRITFQATKTVTHTIVAPK
jgi:RHS repeat-associated protein